MRINVRFAGFYRRLASSSALDLDLEEGATVQDALIMLNEMLEGRFDELFFGGDQRNGTIDLLILVDKEISERTRVLQEGNVLALVPPMSGG
jgi:molybdopterin converting factor small subunit